MPDLHAELLSQATSLLPDTVQLRRDIHQYPELGNDLPRTRERVLAALEPLDLDVRLSQSTSGIVAVLEGTAPGRAILLRGDMDALPMPEDTGLEFASVIEGRMHACGHDSHTAMLATAARVLSERRAELPGKVIFMFQPGEEGPGGAQPMIDEGLFDDDARPDAAFALHIYPNLPSGVIACRAGAFLAAADTVSVRIEGKGGHASMPYDANDPVPVLCELVQAFQTFVTRRFKPFDPVVLTVGRIAAGTVSNVIPEQAILEATLRSFSDETRTKAQQGIRRLAAQIAAAYEMQAEVIIDQGYPVTHNDAGFVNRLRATTCRLLGEQAYLDMPAPLTGAEDFSLMLQRTPGAMAFLGVAPDGVDADGARPCHSNRMQLNEAAMVQGVALHAAVACDFLSEQ